MAAAPKRASAKPAGKPAAPVKTGESAPSETLTDEETAAVEDRKSGSAKVLHEVVRLQGDEELDRPAVSLILSGLAGGVGITASGFAGASLASRLGPGPASELVAALGYSVGFIIVVMGRLQLFTETTVTAVLPVAANRTGRNVVRLLRLWALVLVANLTGTFAVAALVHGSGVAAPPIYDAMMTMADRLAAKPPLTTLLLGVPAGFLVGSIAWILPNARGSEVWVILVITYVIAIAGFTHIVAGSMEIWLLVLDGRIGFGAAVTDMLLPTLAGNIIGGTGLFAILAHGQVRAEI